MSLRAVPIGLGREGRREPTVRVAKLRGGLPRLPTAIQRAGTRLASRQRRDSEWTVTARGLRAVPIGLGGDGRREPTVRVAKLRGGLPRLPTAIQTSVRPRTWHSGGCGGRAAPRMGQNGVPAPPPDGGRWIAGGSHTITNPALPTRNPRGRTEPNRNPAASKKQLRSE